MGRKKTYIVCFLILIVATTASYIFTRRMFRSIEAFQSSPTDRTEEELAEQRDRDIGIIMFPRPGDTFNMEIPRPLAEWALDTYNRNKATDKLQPLQIRSRLVNNFKEEMGIFTTLDNKFKERDALWNGPTANPQLQTCKELTELKVAYMKMLNDLKGTAEKQTVVSRYKEEVDTAIERKGENRAFQLEATNRCSEAGITADCVNYAQLDYEYLIPNLQTYEEINNFILEKEEIIKENVDLINKIAEVIGCNLNSPTGLPTSPILNTPEGTPPIDPKLLTRFLGIATEKGLGSDLLSLKLKETSPYLLTPDAVKFILSSLVSAYGIDSALENINGLKCNIKKTTDTVKSYAS